MVRETTAGHGGYGRDQPAPAPQSADPGTKRWTPVDPTEDQSILLPARPHGPSRRPLAHSQAHFERDHRHSGRRCDVINTNEVTSHAATCRSVCGAGLRYLRIENSR